MIPLRESRKLNEQGGCGYLDIITFYHHAGLIAAAVQDFPLAVELFSIVSSSTALQADGRSFRYPRRPLPLFRSQQQNVRFCAKRLPVGG